MKTAISVPDKVFKKADRIAKRLGMSRSELYSKAVASFIARYDEDAITEALNKVYAGKDSRLEKGMMSAQVRVIEKEEW